ncbi:MAG: TRAP transporter small permease [Hyphomicrobiales bacterium]
MNSLSTPHTVELRARAILLRTEAVIASVAIVMMVGALVLQVSARFLFEIAVTWTDEVAIFSFIWVSLVGAAIAVETHSVHLIDYFAKKFSPSIQRIIQGLVFAGLLGTLWVLLVYGIDITEVVNSQRSSVLGLRMSFVYGAMPFSAALMMVSMLFDWRRYLLAPATANKAAG